MGSSRITPELIEAICEDLEVAVPLKYAAEAQGLSESTVYEWLAKAKAGNKRYTEFADRVKRAQAKAVGILHRAALIGGKGSSGATWLLSKRYRKDYGDDMPALENDKPLEIVQRRLDPVQVPVNTDGRALAQGE